MNRTATGANWLAAAYRVPRGFCLTAAAFAEHEIPNDEVAKAYQALAAQRQEPHPGVAVRSSAIDEDGTATSFAGLYESYLNVVGVEDVIQAIARCWALAKSERIRAYRQQRGLADSIPLAVLVQELISADASAVVFSTNPVTDSTDEIVINANWGLGESIVGGTATPDNFAVSRSTLALTSSHIADKHCMTVRTDQGTQEVSTPRFLRTQPALSEGQILEVAHLVMSLEREMGWPVDVECAYQAETLVLLQCRPITALRASV